MILWQIYAADFNTLNQTNKYYQTSVSDNIQLGATVEESEHSYCINVKPALKSKTLTPSARNYCASLNQARLFDKKRFHFQYKVAGHITVTAFSSQH